MLVEGSNSVIIWVILYIALGCIFYFLDRWFGVAIYHWFYGMTHKDPLPEGVEKGFIHNRKAQARFANACIVALIFSLIEFHYTEHPDPLMEFFSWVIEVPLVMIGFIIGPFFFRIWGKKEDLFQTVDKIESGEIDVSKQIKNAAEGVAKDFLGKATDVVNDALDTIKKQEETPKTEPQKEAIEEKEEEIDPKEYMNKYLNK